MGLCLRWPGLSRTLAGKGHLEPPVSLGQAPEGTLALARNRGGGVEVGEWEGRPVSAPHALPEVFLPLCSYPLCPTPVYNLCL